MSKRVKRASSFDSEPIFKKHLGHSVSAALARIRKHYMRTGVIADTRMVVGWRTYCLDADYAYERAFARRHVGGLW